MKAPNGICRTLRIAAAAAACALLAACETGPQVRMDYDHNASFQDYKTYGFASPLGTDRNGYEGAISRYLKVAARRELDARGLRYEESNPDLIVNFNGRLSDKLRTTPATLYPPPGYYGYRRGYYGAWPGYAMVDTVEPYTEGTLNIDIVDMKRKQLVWEGVVTDSVTDKTLADPQPAIEAAVKAALAKYPPTAPAAYK
ncbi:MAG TPA: DUF4136 domain-containing protein [Usitatibacter sp.]|nr:DUF4136 domain-containing protein [Usitatibacter sp.]